MFGSGLVRVCRCASTFSSAILMGVNKEIFSVFQNTDRVLSNFISLHRYGYAKEKKR